MKKLLVFLIAIAMVFSFVPIASATQIFIENFDSPGVTGTRTITDFGWVEAQGTFNKIGAWAPPSHKFNNPSSQVAYAYDTAGSMRRFLGIGVTAGTYTLSVDVGNPLGNPFPEYNIWLLAYDGTNYTDLTGFASGSVSPSFPPRTVNSGGKVTPTDGDWATYTSSVAVSSLMPGQQLVIQLGAFSLTSTNPAKRGQIAWDNVNLDFTPVPEPGTLLLLGSGLAGLGIFSRRRKKLQND